MGLDRELPAATMDPMANVNRRLDASRTSGVLNLRGEGLEEVPRGVYDKDARSGGGNWWEVRLLAGNSLPWRCVRACGQRCWC